MKKEVTFFQGEDMKRLLVVMLLLYPLSALAQTYQWTDHIGTVHFADDLGNVPKKYRKKAKIVGGEESGAPQSTEITEPVQKKSKGGDEQQVKKLYGGKDESTWRKEFVSARYELQHAESELAVLRGRMSDTSRMSRSEYLSIQNTIKHSEVSVQQLQKKLDLLEQSADRLGVPMGFRK
jgi:hypothetical protein